MVPGDSSIADWIQLVRGEYLESPGLHLTEEQVRRLWGLDATTCEVLLDTLVRTGFLRRTHGAGYVRANTG